MDVKRKPYRDKTYGYNIQQFKRDKRLDNRDKKNTNYSDRLEFAEFLQSLNEDIIKD